MDRPRTSSCLWFNVLILALTSLIAILLSPAHAATPSTVEVSLNDSRYGYWLDSKIFGYTFKKGTTDIAERLNCEAWNDPACKSADQLLAELIMRPCLEAIERGCIESLAVSVGGSASSGEVQQLRLLGEGDRTVIREHRFNGAKTGESYFIPAGGGVSVWESTDKATDGTPKLYMAHVLTRYSYFCGDLSKFVGDFVIAGDRPCEIATIEFKGSVLPVTLTEKVGTCDFFAFGENCIQASNFTSNERVELTLRQEKNRTGWLFGRMSDAEFALSKLDSEFNKVRISGVATFVPALKAVVEKSEISRLPKLERFLKARFDGQGGRLSYQEFLNSTKTIIDPQIYDQWEIFDAFEEQLKPVSNLTRRTQFAVLPASNSILWNFASAIYDGSDLHPCSADKSKLHGLVVTNSPLYASGPPKFVTGALDYQVAGAHLNEDGSVFRGSYTFVVKSETARCYYGFSDAPVQATVSVIASDGQTQVATTTVAEKDGFLTLSAQGFTFSSPKIRVKLAQTQAPMKKTQNQSKITCKNGKKIVSVPTTTGNPAKCPKGFRKAN